MAGFKKILGTAALAGTLFAAAAASHASVVWGGNGHEYDVITAEDISWTAANAAASGMGGGWHLATITSAAENAFVAGLLPTGAPDRSHFWLGGSDAASEGTWTWVTGEPYDAEAAQAVAHRPTVELSKIYVLPEQHRSGIAAELMGTSVAAGLSRIHIGLRIDGQDEVGRKRTLAVDGIAILCDR